MMKRIVTLIILMVVLCAADSIAHEGMLALYADPTASSCQAILPEYTAINLSLFYVRGEGPYMGSAFEFKLLKSSDGIQIGSVPVFNESHGLVGCLGSLENGISIKLHMGEITGLALCVEEDYVFLGNIPIVNISDPDTFTVSVVEDQTRYWDPAILIILCRDNHLLTPEEYRVIGGTFVFNGTCESPEYPFQSPTSVQSSTWGAIKAFYNE